jgi:hypothetical protein
LCLDFPVLVTLTEQENLFSNIHDAFWVVFGNTVQDVQRIYSHVDLRVGQTDEGVVKEHIKPLLVEFLLLPNQVSLASIHYFIIGNVVLQILHNLDPLVEVMLSVAVDQLAYVLSLVGAFLDDLAIVLE